MAKWASWDTVCQALEEASETLDREAIIARWLRETQPVAVNDREVEVGSGSRFDQYHGYLREDD